MSKANGLSGKFALRALLLQVIAYVAFISLGLPDTVNGVAWPSVRDEFSLRNSSLGTITILATLGYLVSSNFTPWLLSRSGVGLLLTLSTGLVAIGLTGYANAPMWTLFAMAALLNGMGSGAIDTSLNSYAARHFSLRSMNWLHGFYMVGAGLGPAIMTGVITQGTSWRVGYGILASILYGLALIFLVTRRQWDHIDEGGVGQPDSTAHVNKQGSESFESIWHNRAAILQSVLFFLQSAMEACAGLWCYTYLVEHRGMSEASAGSLTTFYWVVFGLGRFSLGAVAHYVGEVALVRYGTALALLGAFVFGIGSTSFAVLGLGAIALGLAPVFPTLMSCTPGRVGEVMASRAVGLQVSCAAIGVATMPALAGVVASRWGLAVVPWILALNGLALVLVHETLIKRMRASSA